jgi:hypothetical protein
MQISGLENLGSDMGRWSCCGCPCAGFFGTDVAVAVGIGPSVVVAVVLLLLFDFGGFVFAKGGAAAAGILNALSKGGSFGGDADDNAGPLRCTTGCGNVMVGDAAAAAAAFVFAVLLRILAAMPSRLRGRVSLAGS